MPGDFVYSEFFNSKMIAFLYPTNSYPLKKIFFVLTLSQLLWSCKFDQPEWDVDALAPIAKTTLTVSNMIGDTLVAANPGGDLRFHYDGVVYKLPIDTLLMIPDTGFNFAFITPLAINLIPNFPLNVYNNYVNFNTPKITLTTAIVQSGFLDIQIKSYATQPVILNFTIPKATKNGVVLSFTDTMPAASFANPYQYTKSFNLEGYTMNLTGDDGTVGNRLRVSILATVSPDAQAFDVPAGQKVVETNLIFRKVKPYYAKGRIATQNLNINNDTIQLPFMRLVKDGTLNLKDAYLKFTINNGVGVDLQAKIQSLTGYNSRTGQAVNIQHPIIGNAINVSRAVDHLWQEPHFTPVVKEYEFNSTNSNLKTFLENLPDKIKVGGQVVMNPIQGVSGANDFVFYDSKSEIRLIADMPISFSLNQLLLADTIFYNMTAQAEDNRIQKADLKIFVENKFPFECKLQIYMVDSTGLIADSLFTDALIPAAPMGANNKVETTVSTVLITSAEAKRLDNLFRLRKMYFKVRFNTMPANQVLDMYSDYFMKLKVTAKIKYRI